MLNLLYICLLLVLMMTTLACREKIYQLTPSVHLERQFYNPGDLLKITYSFNVAIREKIPFNGIVRVTFYSPDNEIAFIDSHRPPIKTSDWIPGSVIEYQRCLNIPLDMKPGKYTMTLGLYNANNQRSIRLSAPAYTQYDYIMTRLTVLEIIYFQGFNDYVYKLDQCANPPPKSLWDDAVTFLINPHRNITLHLSIQVPEGLRLRGPHISLLYLNDNLIDTIMFTSSWKVDKDYAVRVASLGKDKYFAVRIVSEGDCSAIGICRELNYLFYDYQE